MRTFQKVAVFGKIFGRNFLLRVVIRRKCGGFNLEDVAIRVLAGSVWTCGTKCRGSSEHLPWKLRYARLACDISSMGLKGL